MKIGVSFSTPITQMASRSIFVSIYYGSNTDIDVPRRCFSPSDSEIDNPRSDPLL